MSALPPAWGLSGDDRRCHFNPVTESKYALPPTINNRATVVKGRDMEGEPTW